MKKTFLALVVLFVFVSCKAQLKGTINLYGFKQAVLPGMIPGDIMTDDGRIIEQPFKPKFNLFIYTASINTITPVEVWLDGKKYSVKTEAVTTTPVEYTNPTSMPQPSVTTIVPKTSKKVLRLTLVEAADSKPFLKNTSMAKEKELIVVYKQGSKIYYTSLNTLKEIEPVAMQ